MASSSSLKQEDVEAVEEEVPVEEGEEYVPSDEEEELEVPLEAPEKVAGNPKSYFVDQMRKQGEYPHWTRKDQNNHYRQMWAEQLSHMEQQQWRRNHKKAKHKFDALLNLYCEAHLGFDADEYYAAQSRVAKTEGSSTRSGRGGESGSRPRRKRKASQMERTSGLGGGHFAVTGLDDGMASTSTQPTAAKRRILKKSSDASIVEDILREMNSSSRGRGRKSRRDLMEEVLPTERLRGFIEEMKNAARDDWISNESKQPALKMLSLLPKVSEELGREQVHDQYLDTGLLEAVRDWLMPFPDGTLPPAETRSEMLRILNLMNLHKKESLNDYFEKSQEISLDLQSQDELFPNKKGFCETVMNLWAAPSEIASNKRLLEKMIRRWLNHLAQKNMSYSEAHKDMSDKDRYAVFERARILKSQKRDFRTAKRRRAQIVNAPTHEFIVRPPVRAESDTQRMGLPSMPPRKKKKTTQTQRTLPSVTGRR